MLAVGRICSAAAGSCFGTSIVSDAATHSNLMHSSLTVASACRGRRRPLLLLSRTNLQKNNAISPLFCNRSVDSFISTILRTPSNSSSGLPSQPRAASHRAIKTRRIRGQIHHFHRVSSSLQHAFHLCHASRHASNTMTLSSPQHRRRFARSSAWPVGDSEATGGFSTLRFGWLEEVHLRI